MAYATIDELRGSSGYLDQLTEDDDRDVLLTDVLNRAAALINLDLGTRTDLAAAATGTQVVYGSGTVYLSPIAPFHTVTAITAPTGYTIPDYTLIDTTIVVTDSAGLIGRPFYPTLGTYGYWPTTAAVWLPGVPYTVAATFGYGEVVMEALKEANLQIAVRLWRFKDSGGSEVIGAEGAAVEVRQQFSPMVKDILRLVKLEQSGSVGVW